MAETPYPPVSFDTHPSRYVHWGLDIEGAVATLTMRVQENRGMWPGYELKLNSYDLSVDLELADAVQRLRFEHPEVRAVVVTGGYDKIFCAGANIKMLASASHAFKVNFCKFTNETRTYIEDATARSGQTWIAALNGTASGGGYELAEACAEIYLIDDGNSAVSLPEVPLLGVLPGTGGLTRLTDKRKVRRDIADVFCTKAEGFKARDAVKHNVVDGSYSRSKWADGVKARSNAAVSAAVARPADARPVTLPEVGPEVDGDTWTYRFVSVKLDRSTRVASLELRGPAEPAAASSDADAGCWAIRFYRELDDALLRLRFNELDIGLLLLRTRGDPALVLAHDSALDAPGWFNTEVRAFQARVLRRLDNMAKTLFAIVEPGNCYAGSLAEILFSVDRSYMLADEDEVNSIVLSAASTGRFPMHNGQTRLQARFPGDEGARQIAEAAASRQKAIDAGTADDMGLVTFAPDAIDWDDEVRIAVEERCSLSPDALTGMEQNLRFGGAESMENKIFGRLTAWQNWIFQRPNAVGERGALKMFGAPERAIFDYRRT
ncbi:MAG: benzoyl-CoA-dihydrodiol lyase [Myxococcales bacterium]|nr:benzoyl-CoA-dihydrodiol lyase [Myxococcales bacterium]